MPLLAPRHLTRSLAAGLALFASVPLSPAGAQRRDDRAAGALPKTTVDSLRARIRHLLDSTRVPSVAVAVARGGRVVWEEGFGVADIERNTPATPNTLYSLASISKPVTATGLMRLVEQGKVQLDRPANDYLGQGQIIGHAGEASAATVRRVLSHTAGLPLHYRFYYAGQPDTTPSMDEAIGRYGIVVFPPGEVYSYSNLGYGVLDQIIARASGRSYEDYMRDEVFRPLGMTRTAIGTGEGLTDAAVRYSATREPIPYYDFDHRGGSAVYSTAHEMALFGLFHLKQRPRGQPRVLADSTIDLMQRVATPGSATSGYGLGWGIGEDFGYRRVSHTGGMPGVATTLNLYPSEGLVIAALANQSHALPHLVAQEIAAALLPRYAAGLAERRARPTPPTPVALPAELHGVWTGTVRTYQGTVPITLRVEADDVHLKLAEERDRAAMWTVLNDPSFRDNLLNGRAPVRIPTDDARRHTDALAFSLYLKDGLLRGWAAAQGHTGLPAGAVSSYVELRRSSITTAR